MNKAVEHISVVQLIHLSWTTQQYLLKVLNRVRPKVNSKLSVGDVDWMLCIPADLSYFGIHKPSGSGPNPNHIPHVVSGPKPSPS